MDRTFVNRYQHMVNSSGSFCALFRPFGFERYPVSHSLIEISF